MYLREIIQHADYIFCNSEHTRKDVLKFIEEQGVKVMPTGFGHLGCNMPILGWTEVNAIAQEEKLEKGKFIVYVSGFNPHKNHVTLFRAYLMLRASGFNGLLKLVCVGGGGGDEANDVKKGLIFSRIEDLVVIKDKVTDAELKWLYDNCLFTVFPSLYEGYGIPVAESLCHGKFCLASNSSSIPEIGGDLIDYAAPWDVTEWYMKLAYYMSHPGIVKEMEDLIKKDYKPWKWEDFGEKVYGALCSM